jgi:hypothetical protein
VTDEALRHAALEALGPLGHPLARAALETGGLELTPDVAVWEASHGTVHGDRVVVRVPAALSEELADAPAAQDELAHAISAALARGGARTLYDLAFDVGETPRGSGPYRG